MPHHTSKKLPRRSCGHGAVLLLVILLLVARSLPAQETGLTQADRGLRTERMLASILKTAPTGIGVVEHRVIVQVNDYVLNLTGYTREELIDSNARMLYPTQADFDYVGREKYRQITERGTGSVETRWQHKDGSIRYVLLSSTPMDPLDLAAGVTFTVLDITDHRLALKALQESEIRYRNLVENAPVGIFRTRSEDQGRAESVNLAMARMLGFETPEAAIAHYPDLAAQLYVDPDRRRKFIHLMQEQGQVEGFEYEARTRDGGRTWLSMNARVISMPNSSEFIVEGFTTDITDRKQAEAALASRTRWFLTGLTALILALLTLVAGLAVTLQQRRTASKTLQAERDQLLSLFNSIDEAIYIADPITHELLYVNRHLAGILPKEWLGAKCHKVLQGLDAPCAFCTNAIILAQKPEPHRWEYYNPRFDRHYAIVDRIIRWPDGRNARFEMAMDITTAKQAQKLLAAKNKELEQIIYVASHDLRSPLVNVDGFSRELEYSLQDIGDLLARDQDPAALQQALRAEFPDMKKSLARIRTSTRQMDGLLKGLLKLSRSGRATLQITSIDMNELIRQLSASFAFRLEEAGIALTVKDLPACRGDMIQVTQVFSNLLDNAIKYLDPNRPGKLTIHGKVDMNRAIYFVEDNGIGIAENHQENIFELFHRLNPRDSEGEGLGLTIARQVIGRLDGEIKVASKLGEGTVFTIILPAG